MTKKGSAFLFLVTSFLVNGCFLSLESHKKLLVLVIASDDQPVYVQLQTLWRSYMHLDPEHIEAYFIKADPDLSSLYSIQDDIIWAKTQEQGVVTQGSVIVPGIINKTVIAFEALHSRLEEFDYVLRTNVSSFFIFPRLLLFLEQLPSSRCCSAVKLDYGYFSFCSGAGYLLSSDIIQLIRQNKDFFMDRSDLTDDVLLGLFLHNNNIAIIPSTRIDFLSLSEWHQKQARLAGDIFHFRVKNNQPELRLKDDCFIYAQLINRFYTL